MADRSPSSPLRDDVRDLGNGTFILRFHLAGKLLPKCSTGDLDRIVRVEEFGFSGSWSSKQPPMKSENLVLETFIARALAETKTIRLDSALVTHLAGKDTSTSAADSTMGSIPGSTNETPP